MSRGVYRRSDQGLNKNTSVTPRTKKYQRTPGKHPSQTCKATHRSAKDAEPIASGVCGERGAGRLRLVILRRECSPNKGARGPAARPLVRRSPRTPRKAGDGGLTGNTAKPYSAPSPALRRPPPPRRWRGGGRARPPYPAVSRARLPDGRATPREGPRGPDAPRVEAPSPKSRGDGVEVDARGLPTRPCLARGFQTAARRRAKAHAAPRVEAPPQKNAPAARAAPAALSSCSCHVGHTTTVHPLAIHREALPRSC